MCGYQANQMTRQAATDKTSQIANRRQPCLGSGDASAAGRRWGVDRAHADTTSISPIIHPRVCMGPLLPSRNPPPQGTKHCQRYVPVVLGDMKLNVSTA